MKSLNRWIGLLALPILTLAGCHELGHDGPGDYGSVGSNNIVGEIQYINSNSREIDLRLDSGRSSVVRFDANTKVVYQQRSYSVSNLEPGDQVTMRAYQEREGRLYTDLVTVRDSVQNRVYSGTGDSLRGTVLRNDTYANTVTIESANRRQLNFTYDAQTRIRYRDKDLISLNIQAGDNVTVRLRDRNKQLADLVLINSTVQDRASKGSGTVSRLDSLEGRVEYIDSRRGLFELRGTNNRLIVVNLQNNPPQFVADRFNRLRNGDNVRIEGRYLNQDRFELENFL